MLTLSLNLALIGLPLLGKGPAPSPAIVSAYVEAERLRFDSPIPLPWDIWVPADLQLQALARDSVRRRDLLRQRSDFGYPKIGFTRLVPPELEGRFYYLLDSSGVHRVRPTGLVATARIQWQGSSAEVQSVTAFGQLEAPDDHTGLGGFVLVSETPLTFSVSSSQFTADSLLAPHGESYAGRGHRSVRSWRNTRDGG